MLTDTRVFVIREIATGRLIKFSNAKCGWCSSNAAKSAFILHMRSHYGKSWGDGFKFEDQDDFLIEEVV